MCIIIIIVVVIILLIISSLLSTNNSPIVPENFNTCYRRDNQAISTLKNPLKFIKNGKYKIKGYVLPTTKFPSGLISIGKAEFLEIGNNGKKITNSINFYDRITNKFKFNSKNTFEYLFDPYGRIYTMDYTFVNKILKSVRNGVAINIASNRIVFDIQGSLFVTDVHHENIKYSLQKISENEYKIILYADDVHLLYEMTYTFIEK